MIEHLEEIKIIEPGHRALVTIAMNRGKRFLNRSKLIFSCGECVWCNVGLVKKPRRRWCSEECIEAARLWCDPQSAGTKMWTLIHRQKFACSGCGESYEDHIKNKVKRLHEDNKRWNANYPSHAESDEVTYFQLGYNTGDLWHVDHIVPIFKGGGGVGLSNIQVLCVPCHKRKTVEERR